MLYLAIKHLHMTTAILSGIGFLIRGILVQMEQPVMQNRWLRILPHINDTILLFCAIWLAWKLRLVPGLDLWLSCKIFLLILYVVFGVFALRKGRGQKQKAGFFAMALWCYLSILAIAINRPLFLIF
ncbi:SirB2 family protein [Gynuella sp.]|uniref:SirB2 family protein n=1 Tax=Gynuella sp. TaxID=2969146 RepID=UPI003D13E00B